MDGSEGRRVLGVRTAARRCVCCGQQGSIVLLQMHQVAQGVAFLRRRIHARRATVLCAGAWSGQLLDRALGCSTYAQLITPLRGHLLQIPAAAARGLKLARGVMETAYCAVSLSRCPCQGLPQLQLLLVTPGQVAEA
jgi:glycine/D-amino acid oxidase-like deaminating enzyme